MKRIFVSYSWADRKFAESIASDLKKTGLAVWLDRWEIRVGQSIVARIDKAIEEMDCLAIVLSPNSVKSRWVRHELDVALMKQLQENEVQVLPILLQRCDIPSVISPIKYADFSEDYSNGMAELMEALSPVANSSIDSEVAEPHSAAEFSAQDSVEKIHGTALEAKFYAEISMASRRWRICQECLSRGVPLTPDADCSDLPEIVEAVLTNAGKSGGPKILETLKDSESDLILRVVLADCDRHTLALAKISTWKRHEYMLTEVLRTKKKEEDNSYAWIAAEAIRDPFGLHDQQTREAVDHLRFYDFVSEGFWACHRALELWAGVRAFEGTFGAAYASTVPLRYRSAILEHICSLHAPTNDETKRKEVIALCKSSKTVLKSGEILYWYLTGRIRTRKQLLMVLRGEENPIHPGVGYFL